MRNAIRQNPIIVESIDISTHLPLILFDGICHLCTWSTIFAIKRDPRKHFKFASLQSPLGQQLLKQFGWPYEDFKTFVLVIEDGHYTKSTAILKVVEKLKQPWPIIYALIIIPRPIRDWVYDYIARNRYRLFGKRETCLVPTADSMGRFIESA